MAYVPVPKDLSKVKTKVALNLTHLKCNIDWLGWERLSREKGHFVFINKKLMGHRIHEESTTTDIIKNNIRTVEDAEMFSKFWPKRIVKILNKFYIKSEQSNNV